jgi:hypothetical protein
MKTPFTSMVVAACVSVAVSLCAAKAAKSELLYGVSVFGDLVSFNSASPDVLLDSISITGNEYTGLGGGFYSINAIDFRPSTGVLYGLGNAPGSIYQLFTINIATGEATKVGGEFSQSASAFVFGFNFNPVTDQIRLVNNADQNGTINPTTGVYTAATALTIGPASPNIVSASYTNSFFGALSTTLYDINVDTTLMTVTVYQQTPENTGTLVFTSGPLASVPTVLDLSFDISGATGTGFLSAADGEFFVTTLYSVNPTTGATAILGTNDDFLRAVTVAPVPEPGVVALVGLGLAVILARRRTRTA